MTQATRTDEVVHSPYITATREPKSSRRHVRAARLSVCAGIVGALAFAQTAIVQQRRGAVGGVVKDSGGIAVSNVEVMVMWTGRTVRADSAGHFLLAAVPSGHTDIGFRRVAFEPVIVSLQIP